MRREGGTLVMGVVGLLSLCGMVVVAVSSQSGGARSTYASVLVGRRLTGLAESAVAEGQAELPRLLAGIASGEARYSVEPARTRQLIAVEVPGASVTAVRITRLPYDPKRNVGEVELAATASASSFLGRKLVRTVTRRHFMSLGMDRKTFEISEVAHRCRVDCEGE